MRYSVTMLDVISSYHYHCDNVIVEMLCVLINVLYLYVCIFRTKKNEFH